MADINENALDGDIDLQKYLDILLRRRWIIAAFAVLTLTLTALVTFSADPVYKAQTLLLIEKDRGSSKVSDSVSIENTADDYYQTQYMLLKADSLLQKVYDAEGLSKVMEFEDPNGLGKFRKAVTINPVRRSRLVNVQVESKDPALAAKLANAVTESYVRQNLENQLFISKEILEALEVDSTSPQGRRLQEGLPAVVNNPLIQQLKADLVKVQAQAADQARRYTEKHPAMSAINSNIASLQGQIRAETDRVVASLKTELSGQLKGNNVRIVDRAPIPQNPFKPRKARNIGLGGMMGLMGGFLLALLTETLDQTVRTQEDVEQKLSQPFLGMIPFLPAPEKASPYSAMLGTEPSLTSESFRNLRTMADFADTSERKALLVTSTVQEEGKTYVSTNLAVAFAQMGEKVLIIDGDLRRPKVHKNFRLSSKRGLSDFLASGKDVAELEPLVQSTDVPNLRVLVCGTRPPNPSELLNTPRLAAVVAWAKAHYDRVVVDCTPMFPIHDTMLWGRHIPAAIFVSRYGKTRVPLIKNALQRLTGGSIKTLGIAVNAAKQGGLTYAAYGYYYQQYYRSYSEPAKTT